MNNYDSMTRVITEAVASPVTTQTSHGQFHSGGNLSRLLKDRQLFFKCREEGLTIQTIESTCKNTGGLRGPDRVKRS